LSAIAGPTKSMAIMRGDNERTDNNRLMCRWLSPQRKTTYSLRFHYSSFGRHCNSRPAHGHCLRAARPTLLRALWTRPPLGDAVHLVPWLSVRLCLRLMSPRSVRTILGPATPPNHGPSARPLWPQGRRCEVAQAVRYRQNRLMVRLDFTAWRKRNRKFYRRRGFPFHVHPRIWPIF
jgi:hypothetical protein